MSWTTVKISDLFRVASSKRVLKSEWKDKGIPFYRGREITTLSKYGNVENELFISEEMYSAYATKYGVPSVGDIMITAIGTIGNTYVVRKADKFYFKDASVLWLHKEADVDSSFANYWFKSSAFSDQLDKGLGATVDTLTISKVQSLELSLPTLAAQNEIVLKLDAAFAEIDKAISVAQQNAENAKALFQSYLNELVGRNKNEVVEWELGDSKLLQIIDGDRGSNYPNKKDFSAEGYCLFLNTKNVLKDGFSFVEKMFISKEKDEILRKGKLERGDVVLTTRGTLGNIGWYSHQVPFDNVRINSGMLVFRVNNKVILPEFLFELLRSNIVQSKIYKHKSGAAQPQLPIHTLKHFTIPVPVSLDTQREYVNLIKDFEYQSRILMSNNESKLELFSKLKKSILTQAFNGELTKV